MTTAGATQIIAANVRAELARKGITQTVVRRSLGPSAPACHRRWHGHTPWSVLELSALSVLVDLPPSELMANAGLPHLVGANA